ncbi:hypothetical protein P8A22_34170 [Streptomyces laculatispora]|uniref:Uncharacterized protein n=1 Tax=Streptomyces laculatispora TaxID=887464 RepID=A0ABY9IC78_9ACTN|nr:hypothetical protein [Streptomyces laculatispora]WLQ44511.1 hypothetical protein P8A22_34170 [Streptomyces laculatispora]
MCVAELGEVPFDEGPNVPIEPAAPEGKPTHVVAFAFETSAINMCRRLGHQAAARDFVKTLRHVAGAVDEAAAYLAA